MRVVHRLVLVIAFFGALLMLFAMDPMYGPPLKTSVILEAMLLPGLAAAALVYPLVWVLRGFRRQ